MGYAGGLKENPTYRYLGDHTETIQIDFDPNRLNYQDLLTLFWQSHNPTASRPRQYKSAIFYHDASQLRLSEVSRDREEDLRNAAIYTEIQPFHHFYRAEDYHQKYYLRRAKDLLQELQKHYPDNRGLVDATATARINGYLGGYGSPEALASHGDQLGLTQEGRHRLRQIIAWRQP